jgi:hypothetical protein
MRDSRAPHQGQSSLNRANGSIAQTMGFPATFGNADFPKQDFRYSAVAITSDAAIKRPYCE